ncbi:MAG TPA: hypothetical protein VHK69_01670 [Chitinophagaceae bacterium]|jgi:hypothetical protein|nr:hypothetical protein [Chitinophagaceae bacterium]
MKPFVLLFLFFSSLAAAAGFWTRPQNAEAFAPIPSAARNLPDTGGRLLGNIVYGGYCGIAGTPSSERKLLEDAVRRQQTELLQNWLRSPVPELQAYAVEGFHRLGKKGVAPDAETLRLIRQAKARKDLVQVCQGCLFSKASLSSVLASYDF